MIKKIFPILALSMFVAMLGMGIISPLLPLYAESMGASGIWIGLIVSGYAISRIIVMPIVGPLSDRRGRRLFLSIGLILATIVSLTYLLAKTPPQLVIIRLLHGIGSGMIMPIAQAYIGDVSPEGEEGKWMGYSNAAFFGGFGFGPLLGGIVTDQLGMNGAFLMMAGLSLLSFLVVIFFLPEVSRRKTVRGPRLSYKKMGTSSVVKGLISFRMMFALGRGGAFAFIPILAASHLNLSPSLIGIILANRALLASLLGVPGGWLADRFSRRALAVFGSLVTFASLGLVPLAANFWQLFGLTFLQGVGSGLAMPSTSAMTVEEGRRFGMGSTMSIFFMAMSIGMAIGPIVGGAIVDLADINSVFYFAAVMGFIGISLFGWFTRGYRRAEKDITRPQIAP